MATIRAPGDKAAPPGANEALTASELFAIAWDALADVLGTAAVAAIVRRAVRRASARCPELVEVVVVREDLEYRYTLPPAWAREAEPAPPALRELVLEVGALLQELTGTVVISALERATELRRHGVVWREEVN